MKPTLRSVVLYVVAVVYVMGNPLVTLLQRNCLAVETMYVAMYPAGVVGHLKLCPLRITTISGSTSSDPSMLYLVAMDAANKAMLTSIDWADPGYRDLLTTPRGHMLLQALGRRVYTLADIHTIGQGMPVEARWDWAFQTANYQIDLIHPEEVNSNDAFLFIQYLQYLLEIQSSQPPFEHKRQLAELYDRFGRVYYATKEPDIALEWFDRSLALEPLYCEAMLDKGLSIIRLGQQDQGIALMQQSVEACPDYAHGWASLGAEYIGSDLSAAETAIRRSIAIDPSYGWSQFLLAQVLMRQERCTEALLPAQTAVRLFPAADYQQQLGDVYWCLGDKESAIAEYQKLQAISPDLAPYVLERINDKP